jgi:hypothetical protein
VGRPRVDMAPPMLAHIGERAHTKEIPDSAVFLSELTGQDTSTTSKTMK